MLTIKDIETLEIKDDSYREYDHYGMYVQVEQNGSKYYRMKYRFEGLEKVFSAGVLFNKQYYNCKCKNKPLNIVSLGDARTLCQLARIKLKQEPPVDPNADKAIQKQLQEKKSFEDVARDWHKRVQASGDWGKKHAKEIMNSLERDIFPFVGEKTLHSIQPNEILSVFREIEDRGALDSLKKIIKRCKRIFEYGISIGECSTVPMNYNKDTFKRKPKVKHHNYFEKDELPEYFNTLDNYKGEITTILGLKLTMLTFLRTSEIRNATWDEIDFKNKLWTIPASRMKNREVHVVPLSNQSIDILNQLKELNGHFEFVFASYHKPHKQAMSSGAMLSALNKMGYKGKATVHGFRAMASTMLNELNINRDWIEVQLSHKCKDKIRNAYNHASYLPQRTKMMQFWADYLDGLRNDEELVYYEWEKSF